MPRLWAYLFCLATIPSLAATKVTVQQMEQILASAHGQPDEKLNRQLQNLELTERLSANLRARWVADLPGPASRQTLLLLADVSDFLPPPASELPSMAPPTLAEQRQIIARSADFARKTLSHLPDFYATRETLRFANSSGAPQETEPLHRVDSSRDTILYRDGREVVSLSAAERKRYGLTTPGLETSGVFGPMLASVLTDTAQGTLAWSHWEQGPEGPQAVFSYKIPQAKSHYRVELGLKYRNHPAYHGEFAVDPGSGTILRLTIEADMEKGSPVVHSAVLVEYGPITIAGKTYICPLKSVTINVFFPDCTNSATVACGALVSLRELGTQASVNDVSFSQYHVFRAETRILSADSAQEIREQPTIPSESETDGATGPATQQADLAKAREFPVEIEARAPDEELVSALSVPAVSGVQPADVSRLPAISAPAAAAAVDATPVFRVNPGIVYLDVVVRDRHNHVVSGLSQGDFRILEDGRPQTIDSFRAVMQTPGSRPSSPQAAPTEPANVPKASAATETINLILFDLLDTSPVNQAYARGQMLKFLEALPPGQKVGLFVLTSRALRMVQDFTGDSVLLAQAARKLLPESSLIFQSAQAQMHSNDVTGSMGGQATPQGEDTSVAQDLAQDLAAENFQHGQVRSEFVSQAFRALAKATEGFNGRKNLYWLAGSFPLSATSEMLTATRIAVYPISVLGMETNSINAEMNGNGVTAGMADSPGGGRLGAQTSEQDSGREELRNHAEQIAANTGGEAFVDVNDLAGALRQSLESGENYYSLVYSPTDKHWNGKFRKIRVELRDRGDSLSHRQGYFAIPAATTNSPAKASP